MAAPIDSDDIIDFFQVPLPPDGFAVTNDTQVLLGDEAGNAVYRGAIGLLKALFQTTGSAATGPVVAFLSPANGATLTAGTPVFLQVTATEASGIAQVEFFAAGKTLGLGTATGSTYTVPYTPTGSGTVNFSAKATSVAGGVGNASVFAVLAPAASAALKPTVSLLPVSAGYVVGQLMALNATASETGGTIAKVEFFDGGTLVGLSTSSPYSTTYTPTSAGPHYFSAKATDALGASTTSTVQTVQVAAVPTGSSNTPPIVRFISATPNPATAGQQLILTAGSSDSDGTVTQVEFFDGTTSLGVKTQTPYALTTLPTLVGQHVYFVKSTDNQGATATDSLTVMVNPVAATASAPGRPLDVYGTAGNKTVRVEWAVPDDTGGRDITSYTVRQNGAIVGTTASLFYIDNAVTNGTAYTYTIAATNSVGTGAQSLPSSPVTPTAGNVLPVAQAGAAQTITQPASSASFSGSGSDADGSIVSQAWSQVNGPAQATITNGNTYAPTMSGLTAPGSYTFRLTVTDNSGGTGSSDVTVTVNAATVAPSFALALNPGDNVDTLTYSPQSQGQVRYNNPVQTSATTPGAGTMAIFYPDLSTQIGQLNFDFADGTTPQKQGVLCAVVLNGQTYTKNSASGTAQPLTFTDGSVLLSL